MYRLQASIVGEIATTLAALASWVAFIWTCKKAKQAKQSEAIVVNSLKQIAEHTKTRASLILIEDEQTRELRPRLSEFKHKDEVGVSGICGVLENNGQVAITLYKPRIGPLTTQHSDHRPPKLTDYGYTVKPHGHTAAFETLNATPTARVQPGDQVQLSIKVNLLRSLDPNEGNFVVCIPCTPKLDNGQDYWELVVPFRPKSD